MSRIKSFFTVSRWKIQLVSIATVLLGPLYAADSFSQLYSIDLVFFALFFFSTVTFSCNINCYHDRKVDSLKKIELSQAVEDIGIRTLRDTMYIESIISFTLLGILFFRGYPIVSLLGIIGWILAYAYSAPPFRLKSRGFLSPIPVNIGVYVLPILAGHYIVSSTPSSSFLVFLAGYAILNLGINLVNVAEDHEVDKSCGIETISHKLGVGNTVAMAGITTLAGAVMVIVTIYVQTHGVYSLLFFSMMVMATMFTSYEIWIISSKEDKEKWAQKKGRRLPLYFIGTRYPMILLLLFSIL